ncbi:MAG: hypothetical protein QM674_06835 [Burkholderiaceae bacterium]
MWGWEKAGGTGRAKGPQDKLFASTLASKARKAFNRWTRRLRLFDDAHDDRALDKRERTRLAQVILDEVQEMLVDERQMLTDADRPALIALHDKYGEASYDELRSEDKCVKYCWPSRNCRTSAMSPDRYTYRVTWSIEDDEHVGLCAEWLRTDRRNSRPGWNGSSTSCDVGANPPSFTVACRATPVPAPTTDAPPHPDRKPRGSSPAPA